MELKPLRYFLMLANELHFQRAARLLCVTQPALSQQIKNLEAKLEQTLFERDRQGVKLTQAGELLLEEISPILEQLDKALDKVRYLEKSGPRQLKICIASYVGLRAINLAFMRFYQAHPDVDLQRIQSPGDQIQDLVREGQIDAGFTPNPVTHPALVVKKVVEGDWVLLVPKQHPLAKTDTLDISELRNIPLIFFAQELNPTLYKWVLEQIQHAGGAANVVLEATQVSSAMEMVREELGCYLLMDYLVSPNHDLHLIELTGFPHPTRFKFVWHEDNDNPALHAFITFLRDAIEECEREGEQG